MGLLDFASPTSSARGLLSPPAQPKGFLPGLLADPWMRLGLALLEQGGPSPKPHSVGQDISRAFGTLQAQDDAQLGRTLQQEELERLKRKNEREEEDRQRTAAWMQQVMPLITGQPQASAITPPQVGPTIAPPAGAPAPNAAPSRAAPAPIGSASPEVAALIEASAKKYGLDPRLITSMMQSESNFDPRAVSNKGARGLMQVMPATAAGDLGISDPEALFDPATNIDAGARYFKMMRDKFGNDRDALRAYNAGPGNASMSPTMSGEYADTILGRLGAQAADAPAGEAPAVQPQFTPGGQARLPPMPQQVRDQLLLNAYQQSGGDPVAMMRAFGKAQQDWTMANAKAATEAAAQAPFKAAQAALENKLATERDAAKSARTYSEEEQKLFAKEFFTVNDVGRQAQSKRDKFAYLETLLSKVPYTGAGGQWAQSIRRTLKAVGADVEGVGEGDAANALANQLALEARSTSEGGGMPGQMSNADREFLVASVPGLTQTEGGNKLLVKYYRKLAERDVELGKQARAYKKKHGKFDDGFYDEWARWVDKNPMLSEADRAEIVKASGGQSQAPTAPTDGMRSKSKSGKPIIFRNGRWEYE